MTYITTLAREGVLLDMTSYFEQWKQQKPELYNQLIPIAWEAASSNGKIYGVAAHATAIVNVFRVDWLNEVGINKPPRTWDGVSDAAIALRDSGNLSAGQYPFATPAATNIGTWITVTGYFMSMGGRYDNGIPEVDSEAGKYLISFYQSLARENLINPDALAWTLGGVRGAFVGDNTAMFTMGINVFPAFKDAGLVYGAQEQWVATEQPRRPGGEEEWRQFGNAFPYIVNSDTDHPEAVLKALQYIVRPEIVGEVANRYQPATNIVVSQDPEWKRTHPWAEDLESAFTNMKAAPPHPRSQQINDALIQLVQEALTNPDEDPAKIAKTFQEELDSYR
jgi:ABC-type glycerol-3-phosphate transport system substrate-binding protein